MSNTNYMEEICNEMQKKKPSFKKLKELEISRNYKIDVYELYYYAKTYYFSGLSGLFIWFKLKLKRLLWMF